VLRGKEVETRMLAISDHAGDKLTRKSRSQYFVYLISALIAWLSKKQATIETSVFGAEFVAMKIGMETLRGLMYKFLTMMDVPVASLPLINGDKNISLIHITQKPESMAKKESSQIC